MIELQSTLDGTSTELKPNHLYPIDFSKLNSVNDLILILASMGIGFPSDHPHIDKLKPFLNLDNAIPLQPNGEGIKLPELKKKD